MPGPWRDLNDAGAVSPPSAHAPTRPTAALGAPLLGHLLVPRSGESRESHPCRSPSRPAFAARWTPNPARSSKGRPRRVAAPPCRPQSPLRPGCCAHARPRRVGGAGRGGAVPVPEPSRASSSGTNRGGGAGFAALHRAPRRPREGVPG